MKITSGTVIRTARKKLMLTQKDLAHILKTQACAISMYENSNRSISVKFANRLSAALGIPPQEILYPNGFRIDDSPKLINIRDKALKLLVSKSQH